MCARYWSEGPGNATLEQLPPVWPSKEACCQAGGGAYEKGAWRHALDLRMLSLPPHAFPAAAMCVPRAALQLCVVLQKEPSPSLLLRSRRAAV